MGQKGTWHLLAFSLLKSVSHSPPLGIWGTVSVDAKQVRRTEERTAERTERGLAALRSDLYRRSREGNQQARNGASEGRSDVLGP